MQRHANGAAREAEDHGQEGEAEETQDGAGHGRAGLGGRQGYFSGLYPLVFEPKSNKGGTNLTNRADWLNSKMTFHS